MKSLVSVLLIVALCATDATADTLDYDLEVSGMVCAFCAYNVSKQLESIDGVNSGSINVDLKQGRVRLQSEEKLDRAEMADLLLQAGFNLEDVTTTASSSAMSENPGEQVMLLSTTMNPARIADGEFDLALEALGAIAAKQSGRITVVGPDELEIAILRPILGGRRTVIKVDYKGSDTLRKDVTVSVFGDPLTSSANL